MLAALEGFPATAVLVLPPYFFKPVSSEGLKLFYRTVLTATSHTVLLYNVPKYAVPVPTEVVKALPVWGVKDSGGEPGYAETLLAADRGVLLGTEDDLWRRLGIGAKGVVSALANFVPEEIVEVYRRAKAGEEAGAGSSQRGSGGRGPRPKSTPPRRCSRSSRRPAMECSWAPSALRSCRPRATTTLARCWTSRKRPVKEARPTPSLGSIEPPAPRCDTPQRVCY